MRKKGTLIINGLLENLDEGMHPSSGCRGCWGFSLLRASRLIRDAVASDARKCSRTDVNSTQLERVLLYQMRITLLSYQW